MLFYTLYGSKVILFFKVRRDRCNPGWPRNHFIVKDDFELLILSGVSSAEMWGMYHHTQPLI